MNLIKFLIQTCGTPLSKNKRRGGVRSTLLQHPWALADRQLGNIGPRDASKWALKESLRRTMLRSKSLSNCSPCWQHCGRMLPRAQHVTRPLITQRNKTITCNAASKREARSEGPHHEARAELWTSDFHSETHSATGFQNLTHLRISENHKYSLTLVISTSILAHTFWNQSSVNASDA